VKFKPVIFAPLNCGVDEKVGTALDPVKFPKTLLAFWFGSVNTINGVVVGSVTFTATNALPVAETLVTVPVPPPPLLVPSQGTHLAKLVL